jgi:CRISPR-associated protein Cmr5
MATQTLQQLRARHALIEIKRLESDALKEDQSKKKSTFKKLKSRASELPFMIHSNGLGSALAFFVSKKGKDDADRYGELFEILQRWLTQSGRPFEGETDLMQAITMADFNTYRLAQAESIQYMDWVKKFSCAYFVTDDEGHA